MWNMEEKKIQGFEQAVRVLPLRLRQEAMALPADQRARVEELREFRDLGYRFSPERSDPGRYVFLKEDDT
mgnify:CR=1 FL=1